jgi:tRNA U38,U39,U40 pseudouridine synthase TruA
MIFSSFRAKGCQAKTPIRSINQTTIEQVEKKNYLYFSGTIIPLSANKDYGWQFA